jgi:chromosome segregation ATPase
MDASMYTGSRSQSYLENTLPQVEASSAASTPLALPPRRGGDKGPLNDGNQLSLREQENVIDRIEKENFGLKLKIHFLEDALRKAGPGFSEAALKENTELKVDKVTMQRELHRYKKHLTAAERDLETYRQQMLELQEKAKRKYADENARAEMDKLQQQVEDRDAQIEELQRQLEEAQNGDSDQIGKLHDDIGDLEAEIRAKDGQIDERDEEIEDLKEKLDEAEERVKDAERKVIASEEVDGQKEDLEHDIRRLEEQLDEANEKAEDAIAEKKRAEEDLAELQEEMANKSIVTKGSSRQSEEKMARLQKELDESEQAYADVEKQLAEANRQKEELEAALSELQSQRLSNNDKDTRIQELEAELLAQADEKDLLQSRRDELSHDVQSLQNEVERLEQEIADLEANLEDERQHALEIEKNARSQRLDEIERLNDEISDLQAEIREKDNLYDTDSDKWETEKQTLESERDRAEEKAAGLQRTIEKLREVEGSLSDRESRLQEAMQSEADRHKSEENLLNRRVEELQDALETRQSLLTDLRNELSVVRDELRQATVDRQAQLDKIAALEDEVDVLQNALEEESGSQRNDLAKAKLERDELRLQVDMLQRRSPAKSPRAPAQVDEAAATRMKWQLSDVTSQLDQAVKEKQSLLDQLNVVNVELDTVKSSLAGVTAERDEIDAELHRTAKADSSMLRSDHERLNLRTAKMKLENEVRRLKDGNKALADQRDAIEQTLEQEITKAAEEEERLGQEIRQLQAKLRSPSDSYELTAARRTIRELERRVEDYEAQLAAISTTGTADRSVHDVSIVRKDLAAARQRELDFLQREAANRETVKSLKHQIADLEHELHEKEIAQLVASPTSPRNTPGRDGSSAQLRQQLISLRQSMNEIKVRQRESERVSAEELQALQQQLEDTEDQKIVLEELLDDARQQAEELTAEHEKALRRLKLKLEQAQRDSAAASSTTNGTSSSKTDRNLRKSQAEVANLEHDVRQQQEMLDALASSEASLRRKLERARSERAAYRVTAEKLQKDLRKASKLAQAPQEEDARAAIETVVRAAEGAETRHKKELRGAVVQMEWMQKRWEREASLRSDAAYAKKFLQLQLDVANAWYVSSVPLFNKYMVLTHSTATRRSSASSSPSALDSWAAAKRSQHRQHRIVRPPKPDGQRFALCFLQRGSLRKHASRRERGANRRLFGGSWSGQQKRQRGQGGQGNCALWRWKRHRDRSRWPGRNGDSFCHIEGRFRIGYVLCISISAPLDERLGVKHGAFRTGQCDESVSRYLRRFDLMLNPTNCIWFTLCFPSGEVIVPLISKLGHHRARHSREHRMDTPDATYGIAPHFV